MNLPSYELRNEKVIKERLKTHVKNGTVVSFDEELLEKIKNMNVFGIGNFFKIFEMGINISKSSLSAQTLSYLFDEDFILVKKGKCDLLKDSSISNVAEHAWVVVDDVVYDTTLMLKIQIDVAYQFLGYLPDIEISSEYLKSNGNYQTEKEYSTNGETKHYKELVQIEMSKPNL